MPSILDEFFSRFFYPNSRKCVVCMRVCPTEVGQDLPEGWAEYKNELLPIEKRLYLVATERDVLCPPCLKWHREWAEKWPGDP